MRLDATSCRNRMAAARVAYLATAGADLKPHVVPVTFAADGRRIYLAVDQKPKTTTQLRRLRNIAENPHVALLCDRYDDDWRRLWWVRADGTCARVDDASTGGAALRLLVEKYPQYRTDPPRGPVLAVTITSWIGWAYGDPAGGCVTRRGRVEGKPW